MTTLVFIMLKTVVATVRIGPIPRARAPRPIGERLVEVWPELLLPRRARELWETRFPRLRDRAGA